MKAIVFDEFGASDVMVPREMPVPEPGPGQVRVRIEAAGVNHVDLDIRAGVSGMPVSFPHIPGVDAAGMVDAVGPGVTMFAPGDRVVPHYELSCGRCRNCIAGRENICLDFDILGGTRPGTYAEYVVVGAHNLMRIPDGLSAVDAVSSFVPFATAWEALVTVGRIQAGEAVLVNAAGSGVGSAGVQVAALAGARVIATAGSAAKLERARELGAEVTINYQEQDVTEALLEATGGLGVALALDMVGGELLKATLKGMASGGRIVTVGAHAGEVIEIDFIELFRKHIAIHGCGRSTRAVGERVMELVAAGRLAPVIDRVLPLDQAAEAHRLLEARACVGRLALSVA